MRAIISSICCIYSLLVLPSRMYAFAGETANAFSGASVLALGAFFMHVDQKQLTLNASSRKWLASVGNWAQDILSETGAIPTLPLPSAIPAEPPKRRGNAPPPPPRSSGIGLTIAAAETLME